MQKYSNFFSPGQVLEYACQADQVNRRYFLASDYTIRVWRPDGSLAFTLNGHTQPVTGLAWSPNERYLVGGATDYKLWRADGMLVYWLDGSEYVTTAWGMVWSPGGKLIASGGSDSLVHLWSADGAPLGTLSGHTGAIRAVAWSPDGKILASGSED